MPNLDQNRGFLVLCDLEIWRMTLKNNRAPFLCYFKLCAAFHGHWWIQTGVTVRKRPIRIKNGNFLFPCDLEIWVMTLKNNRAPLLWYMYFKFCASFMTIDEFKLELQSRNAHIKAKFVYTMSIELLLQILCNIFLTLKWILMMRSGHNISHYTTAKLSIHVWNHDLIWWQNKIDTQKHFDKNTITSS